ncbi:MAG: anaerobic ribonucleoside-triphosphate reductase activating protein [Desulfosudaceae bacterium]
MMVIGGLQKISVIDFPGKVSCVLFCAGCNFHCPYCHNPDLISADIEPLFSGEAFQEFLEKRRGFLDGVVITGGEPTLNEDLAAWCGRIKDLGLAVKLDTNGSRPAVLERLLDSGCVDYLAMDVKTVPEKYPSLLAGGSFDPGNIRSSIEMIKQSGLDYEFRTTCVRPFVDEDVMSEVAGLVAGAPLYVLQQCRLQRVLAPEFFDQTAEIGSEELERFRALAAGQVDCCQIR